MGVQVQMTRLLLDPGRATIVQRLDVACKRATFMRARLSIDERQATWSRLDSLRACFDGFGPIRGARRPPQRQLSTHATRQIGQHQDRPDRPHTGFGCPGSSCWPFRFSVHPLHALRKVGTLERGRATPQGYIFRRGCDLLRGAWERAAAGESCAFRLTLR